MKLPGIALDRAARDGRMACCTPVPCHPPVPHTPTAGPGVRDAAREPAAVRPVRDGPHDGPEDRRLLRDPQPLPDPVRGGPLRRPVHRHVGPVRRRPDHAQRPLQPRLPHRRPVAHPPGAAQHDPDVGGAHTRVHVLVAHRRPVLHPVLQVRPGCPLRGGMQDGRNCECVGGGGVNVPGKYQSK